MPNPSSIQPIGPAEHGVLDYGLVAMQFLAPGLLGLGWRARALSYLFGLTTGLINAFTDQPYALKRLITFRDHGRLETPYVPLLILLPWLTGALAHRRSRNYFVFFFAVAITNYLLTDYEGRSSSADSSADASPALRTPDRERAVAHL